MAEGIILDQLGSDPELGAVIIDTNILDKTDLLQDPQSLTLLFHLRRAQIELALPEVVEHEWRTHYIQRTAERASRVADGLRALAEVSPVFRLLPDVDTKKLADSHFTNRLDLLDRVIRRVPFRAADWESAGRMVLNQLPPSKPKDQQFKDSLLWHSVLNVASTVKGATVLVTEDKGFLDSSGKLLAPTLADEARILGLEVGIVSGIRVLLDALAINLQAQEAVLPHADAIRDAIRAEADSYLSNLQLETGRLTEFPFRAYATESPHEILVVAEAEFEMHSIEGVEDLFADGAIVEVEASVFFDTDEEEVQQVKLKSIIRTIFTPHRDIVDEARWGSALPATRRAELLSVVIKDSVD